MRSITLDSFDYLWGQIDMGPNSVLILLQDLHEYGMAKFGPLPLKQKQ